MTVFSRSWDNTSPADSDPARDGAEEIRHFKGDIQERMAVDHSFTEDANDGKHKKITFIEHSGDPSLDANDCALYTKDTGGVRELYFKDSAGTVQRITYNGILNSEPIGVIKLFAGITLPYGYLWCDGSAISRTTYASLFSAFGSADIYTGGDGSTTFGLPDLRGRAAFGKDDMDNSVGTGGGAANRVTSGGSGITGTTLGASGGAQTVTLDVTQIPSHNHTGSASVSGTAASDGAHTHNFTAQGAQDAGTSPYSKPDADLAGTARATTSAGAHTHTVSGTATIPSQGGDGAHNNMPPAIMLNYIIRAY